jgi:prophage regulatory protein
MEISPVPEDPLPLKDEPVEFDRIGAVMAETGLPKSTIYWMVREGRFPKPVRIGQKSVAWIRPEVRAWMRARIAERDSEAAA